MGWFRKKSNDVLDLTERYQKQQEKLRGMKEEQESSSSNSSSGAIGIFGMQTPSASSSSNYSEESGEDDKRKRLAKRLIAITDKLEELSNQLYHLQQRIEVLEKKDKLGY